MKSKFTTWKLVRFPLIFGSILASFAVAFTYRKAYFGEEIKSARLKLYEENLERKEILERAKDAAKEEMLSQFKNKKM